VLRFLPPYVIEKRHVDQVVRALDVALGTTAKKPASSRSSRSSLRTLHGQAADS